MRVVPLVILPFSFLVIACGGMATRAGAAGAAGAGGACAEPTSAVPDAGVFQAPPVGGLGTFQVTFHNRCAQTIWPAWASSPGLDNSVVDTQLWLPMSPASDRNVTVYGGVREIAFWGRTGCSFDQAGNGVCQTGECGGFICQQIPMSTTVFLLNQGFLGGYNVGLRVEGPTCGEHECVADTATCSDAPLATSGCGKTIACGNICSASTQQCCSRPGSGCSSQPMVGDPAGTGDLVVTFCP